MPRTPRILSGLVFTLLGVLGLGGLALLVLAVAPTLFAPVPVPAPPHFLPTRSIGQIAFTSYHTGNSEIYTVYADGSGLTNLTNHPAGDAEPAWSPDGTQLVFSSDRAQPAGQAASTPPDFGDLYVMAADGSGVRRLWGSPATERAPTWSPDGRQVACVSGHTLAIVNLDGTLSAQVAPGDTPIWSPDSSHLLFAYSGGHYSQSWLYIVRRDGTGLRQLAPGWQPAWAPDGRFIAFTAFAPGGGNWYIAVMNADGTQVRPLTDQDAPGEEFGPRWLPDSQRLSFHSTDEQVGGLHIINADGTGDKKLDITIGVHPHWSPDGQWLVLTKSFPFPNKSSPELYIAHINGSGLTRLSEGYQPAWAPK